MKQIVELTGCGRQTIFEESADNFFYITNSQISRLGGSEITNLSFDELSVFQMGYTNLWLMSRVLLWKPKNFRVQYEEIPDRKNIPAKEAEFRTGGYFILGDKSYLSFAKRTYNQSKSFASSEEAEKFLNDCEDYGEDEIFVIAQLHKEIYWH